MRPRIFIPRFPEPGTRRAFFDREGEVIDLYNAIVSAGNALRQHDRSVRQKILVSGYRGVGKSSVIVEALSHLRGLPARTDAGGQGPLAGSLIEPLDEQRWMILRVSAKNAPSMGQLVSRIESDLQQSTSQAPKVLLSLVDGAAESASAQSSEATKLSFFSRLFSREKDLYERVRASVADVQQAISFARQWFGSVWTQKAGGSTKADLQDTTSARIDSDIRSSLKLKNVVASESAIKMAVELISKNSSYASQEYSLERQAVVDARIAVDALNMLFRATREAELPTIFVVDDFDDVSANVGADFKGRAHMLDLILGPLSELEPTCMVLAVRSEYVHEEFSRKFHQRIHVEAMQKQNLRGLLAAWAQAQAGNLQGDDLEAWLSIANPALAPFSDDDYCLVPDSLLPFATWLYNADPRTHSLPVTSQIEGYARRARGIALVQALQKLSQMLSPADARNAAAGDSLSGLDMVALQNDRTSSSGEGYLRPAIANDPSDTRVNIDPLVCFHRLASQAPA